MKLTTFGFLISSMVFAGYTIGRVDEPLGMIALGICGICVVAQIVSIAKERR